MSSLDPSLIAKLLKEEAEQPTRRGGGGGKRVDPTTVRELTVWNKLHHHICASFCTHRTEGDNPTIPRDKEGNIIGTGASCWNVNCVDSRRVKDETDEKYDRGTQIVCEVKGVYMCRYCFLDKWLLEEE